MVKYQAKQGRMGSLRRKSRVKLSNEDEMKRQEERREALAEYIVEKKQKFFTVTGDRKWL
ncbi:unnamed protein product [marine sediment metagenome]|uniref:Uncharacterized protein n=1 Tax=marine sediment metagenome TaxID=412755 RepID=X0T287_9ZZZZ